MPKFDMGAAWEDSLVLLRSHSVLTGPIAAVFLFLPTLAVAWFGPVPIEPAAGATFDQMMMTFRESARQAVPYQLLVSVISAIGGVGILRLWLSRTSTSVGDALVFALKMIPTMIAIQLFVGALLILGICAYLWGRLAVTSPVVADRTQYNPVVAIQESWRLTKGNGWRIALFLFLVTLVVFLVARLLGGVVGAVGGPGAVSGGMRPDPAPGPHDRANH